ncbi:hypothetical protein ASG73_00975 [Janibacter sp. Soil728]|uniref:ABC transporter substrate-binding protein n=1 Tax=Janibacter sp. Soil728 TaxID=1736393 RepID=UPI0006FB0D0B|nr:ABC transporter substrate-binding protein [Janibacter sp. Soil728]KRE38972.1 hypothetical protein ASG73_00975 [Janibacter sp. Soil728]
MNNHGKRRTAAVGVGALALASMMSACASANGTAGASDKDCGTDLKFGVLTAFTGELGEFGEVSQNSFKLAINDVNASGELPEGWKTSTVVSDEKTDIQVGLRAATDMMQKDKVSVILGPSSGPIVAMDSVATRYKVPIISQFAGTTNFDAVGGTYLFRTVASDASDGEAIAQYLTDEGKKDIVIVVQNDQSTITAGQKAEENFTKSGGKVVKTIKYNPGQASYQSVVQQATGAKADAVYLAGGQESATTILKEMRDAGVHGKDVIVSADLVVNDVITGVGKDWADGLTGVTAKADAKRPQAKALSAAYEKEYGEAPGIFAENAYDALTLAALAAVAGDSTCGESIAENLPKVSSSGKKVTSFKEGAAALKAGEDIDYDGASGPVDFDETGTVPGSYAVFQVADGKWTVDKFYKAEAIGKGK